MTPDEKLMSHEQLCAERYATIHRRLDKLEFMIQRLIMGCITGFGAIVIAVVVKEL